jgi:dihydroxy-acid dehydratase
LKGNLAPDSCVVKRSAVAAEMLKHQGPARVFDCEEDAMNAINTDKIVKGDVVIIRYERPKGGPGMREMLNPTWGTGSKTRKLYAKDLNSIKSLFFCTFPFI